MARKRFLTPDIWSDAAFRKLPRNERLLFIGMITLADDEGRLQASPAYLRGSIFPDDRDLTDDDVKQMRDRIVRRNRNVRLYKVARIHYILFKNWSRYQAPSHPTPSRIPPPPVSVRGQDSREALVNDSGNPHDLGMGVGGGMGLGKGSGSITPLSPPKGGRRRRRRDDTAPLSGKFRDKVQH